jgi:mRNA interferase HigB
MRIIARKTLREFWTRPEFADAQGPLEAWFKEATKADWSSPAEVKAAFASASIVANSRVVFNIAGNKYRLIVKANYPYQILYIRFVGTHAQYDEVDATSV